MGLTIGCSLTLLKAGDWLSGEREGAFRGGCETDNCEFGEGEVGDGAMGRGDSSTGTWSDNNKAAGPNGGGSVNL